MRQVSLIFRGPVRAIDDQMRNRSFSWSEFQSEELNCRKERRARAGFGKIARVFESKIIRAGKTGPVEHRAFQYLGQARSKERHRRVLTSHEIGRFGIAGSSRADGRKGFPVLRRVQARSLFIQFERENRTLLPSLRGLPDETG
jgi:hypothetical protein